MVEDFKLNLMKSMDFLLLETILIGYMNKR